ncbi:MAG: hypothetical protein GXO79_11370 [Chlorobi bacterium]|nr:hypothetical protein [Chlorobiota bacterium]
MKKLTTILLLLGLFNYMLGQDSIEVKRNRIGLNIGYPYVLGLDYERNVKKNERLNIYSSLFIFNYDDSGDNLFFNYLSIGPRIYLNELNKRFYSGLSLGYLIFENKNSGLIIHDIENNLDHKKATYELKYQSIILNPYIGYRAIKGRFTVSPQIGFIIGRAMKYSLKEYGNAYSDIWVDHPAFEQSQNIEDLQTRMNYGITIFLSFGFTF